MLPATIAASLFAVAMNGSIAYAALLAGWRLLADAPCSARLTASVVAAVAMVVAIVQLLGSVGLYSRTLATALAAILALTAHRLWARRANIASDIAAVCGAAARAARTPAVPLLVIALAAWLAAAWRALTELPLGWDSLTYHLPIAAGFVQSGRLVAPVGPLAMDHYARFPKNSEILASWCLLPFHGDLLVGLMNVVLIGCAWLAACALARSLDIERADSALMATAIVTSPFLFGSATTADADPLVFVLILAAALFTVRTATLRNPSDPLLAAAAAGLALGTKYTALPLAGCVLALVAVMSAVRVARWRWRALRVLALAAIVLAFGGRQYIVNTAETGNPIYPLTVGAADRDVWHGSPYTEWLTAELGTGTRGDDRFAFSGMFHYYPDWKAPTSAGPKYVLLIPLALLAAILVRGRQAPLVRFIVLLGMLAFVIPQLPTTGLPALSRRFWPGSIARLSGVAFAAFGVAAASLLTRLGRWPAMLLRVVLAGFAIRDLTFVPEFHAPASAMLAFGAALLGIGSVTLVVENDWRIDRRIAALAVLLAVLIGLPALDVHRSSLTWTGRAALTDTEDAPPEYAAGWTFVQREGPVRIALATGSDHRGQNRFIYPLLGRRLQNSVTWVPVNGSAPAGSRAYVLQEEPREDDWLQEIDRQRIELVVVQAPWPVEDAWMVSRPERFARVFDDPAVRVYGVGALSGTIRAGTR